MSDQNNGEMHVKILTNVCQNVCTFIKTITEENMSKDEKINSFITQINDLHHICSNFKTQQENINEQIKKLACLLSFTINEDDSAINILSQWIQSLSKKNVEYTKKRKLYSSYSPLKLSLKDKTDQIKNTTIKSKCTKFKNEYKIKSQSELKNVWKLQIKRDGNPSDLLQKSKQTKLVFGSPPKKTLIDITTFNNSTSKTSVINSTDITSPEVCIVNNNDVSKKICDTTLMDNTQMDNSNNISISHFNKIIKLDKNISSTEKTNILKPIISTNQSEIHNLGDITICSPLQNSIISNKNSKITNKNVLDSFDIIPGLNNEQNDLPNYKFKEDPVRKRNERKCLNGGNCEDCCKFYEVNNTNPIDAKNAMNHYSRHRSVKNQYYAPTPPGFWDPM